MQTKCLCASIAFFLYVDKQIRNVEDKTGFGGFIGIFVNISRLKIRLH